jgi:hypothetical protein
MAVRENSTVTSGVLAGSIAVRRAGSEGERGPGEDHFSGQSRIEMTGIEHSLGNDMALDARNRARGRGPQHVCLVRPDACRARVCLARYVERRRCVDAPVAGSAGSLARRDIGDSVDVELRRNKVHGIVDHRTMTQRATR